MKNSSLEKDKNVENNIIENTKNLFRLKTRTK